MLTAFNVNIVGRRRHDYGLIYQHMDLMMIISTLQTNLSMQNRTADGCEKQIHSEFYSISSKMISLKLEENGATFPRHISFYHSRKKNPERDQSVTQQAPVFGQ
jgi:hypothetical protein